MKLSVAASERLVHKHSDTASAGVGSDVDGNEVYLMVNLERYTIVPVDTLNGRQQIFVDPISSEL